MQRRFVFVSVADRGLRPKSRLPESKNASKVAGALWFGHNITQEILYARISFLSIEIGKITGEAGAERRVKIKIG